jgi:hypothetical protein
MHTVYISWKINYLRKKVIFYAHQTLKTPDTAIKKNYFQVLKNKM